MGCITHSQQVANNRQQLTTNKHSWQPTGTHENTAISVIQSAMIRVVINKSMEFAELTITHEHSLRIHDKSHDS